jgi:hypothetical protein
VFTILLIVCGIVHRCTTGPVLQWIHLSTFQRPAVSGLQHKSGGNVQLLYMTFVFDIRLQLTRARQNDSKSNVRLLYECCLPGCAIWLRPHVASGTAPGCGC